MCADELIALAMQWLASVIACVRLVWQVGYRLSPAQFLVPGQFLVVNGHADDRVADAQQTSSRF
ncbi:hypothetical protein CSQ89_08900 [Chitinimonas sp. BJB300]|nr:hypothetical protein CSQ89_08900 [Chitinimonas sp. BJB300]